MPQYLVIVESPAKAKTIKKYLGTNYKVTACMGHVRDLPKSQMGVDIENNFEPKYITIRGKGELLSSLKKMAKTSDKIFLATDPDREGEAISWHLGNVLDEGGTKLHRIAFNEITKTAVQNAIKSPRAIDKDLVDAQQARRVLDRIVGYKIGPLLWKNVRKGLSAGRVQSVATRIIVDREREIQAFIPEEYWTITANLAKIKSSAAFVSNFYGSKDGLKIELPNKQTVDAILSGLDGARFTVGNVKTVPKTKSPAPPFTTSSMQQDASRKLNFTAKKTMSLAQRLYEGVEVGGSSTGLITYMRTDSLRISSEAQASARNYIKNAYGDSYLPAETRFYKSKKNSQDAHEAIRPTHIEITPDQLKNSVEPALYKLYKLIWERFIASQMSDMAYDATSAEIIAGNYMFKSTGTVVTFAGFSKVYEHVVDAAKGDSKLPPLEAGEGLDLKSIEDKQHFTQPPARFTEASLIKFMEEEGIGRPSTYAPTINTILTRGYVVREAKSLIPTELGFIVTDIMAQHFPDIVDTAFTANMEQQLDAVGEGEREWVNVLSDFYAGFEPRLKKAEDEIGHVELKDEESDIPCEKCGRMMVYKMGRFGKFLACPGFPDCRNAKPITKDTGVLCPKCSGKILERKSKRGKEYYGCEHSPSCDFVLWDMPTEQKCSLCDSIMVQKKGRNAGIVCSNKDCEKKSTSKSKGSAGSKKKTSGKKRKGS